MAIRANFAALEAWLEEHGCDTYPVKGDYEIARWRMIPVDQDGNPLPDRKPVWCIIWRNKTWDMKMSPETFDAVVRFAHKKPMAIQPTLVPPKDTKRKSWRQRMVDIIVERDGTDCFYCGKDMQHQDHAGRPVTRPDMTVEHLLARKLGKEQGVDVNHLDNLKLAHAYCNRAVDHQEVHRKLAYRSIIQGARNNVPFWEEGGDE